MFAHSVGALKRFAILIPGIVIAYLSVRNIFPYFDHRLPLGLAIFVTYALGAYVLVPAIIRIIRIARPATHLPLYCVTPDGLASDPLNIGIIATRRELIKAMEKAGWYMADPKTPHNLLKQIVTTLLRHDYAEAPVSSLYLFGRPQDIAFEIPIPNTLGSRHHVRFWATTYHQGLKLSNYTIHWHKRKAHVQADNLLWVGAASLDVGLTFVRHTLQISHMVAPDTNRERDFIMEGLKKSALIASVQSIKLGNPYELINRVFRGYLRSDGKMSVIQLRQPSNKQLMD